MIHTHILSFLLLFLMPTHADSVTTIGGTTKIIKKSTSCDKKNWGNEQKNACACCLTRQKSISSDKSDTIIKTCIQKKHCTLETLANLAPGKKTAEDVITEVLWTTIDTPTVPVDANYIDKKGKLIPEQLPSFLTKTTQNIQNLSPTLLRDLSNPRCLDIKSLNAGGANTAQLFLVKIDEQCLSQKSPSHYFAPKYILKETSKGTEEIKNLRRLHQSDLKNNYDLLSPTRKKDNLAITFDVMNFKYTFKNDSHYLSLLPLAPGKSFMNLSKEIASSIKTGNTEDIRTNSDHLFQAFHALGKGLGELHLRFMDQNNQKKELKDSLVHGDLHLENIFADPAQNYLITLIDNETFAKSLVKKRPVAVDLFVLYAFPIAQFKGQYKYPKEISLTMWNNLMLKPLLQGYLENWPQKEKREKVKAELKEIFTTPSLVLKLLSERFIFINPLTYRSKILDIKRIFDSLP